MVRREGGHSPTYFPHVSPERGFFSSLMLPTKNQILQPKSDWAHWQTEIEMNTYQNPESESKFSDSESISE